MKFYDILSVVGMPGLYKKIGITKGGLIVESIADGKRFPVLESAQKVSLLAEVSIFMKNDDLPLGDVFQKMKESDTKAPEAKAETDKLQKYFSAILPEIDLERVHASHMKKIITWFELLKDKVDFAEKVEEGEDGTTGKEEGQEKPLKIHESHGPKADQHKKTTTVKLRKKV